MKNCLLLIALFFSFSAFAEYSIKGKVTDCDSGEPILFGNVLLYQKGKFIKGVETDLDGLYLIGDLPKGVYDIEVSYVGYPSFKKEKLEVFNEVSFDAELCGSDIDLEKIVMLRCGFFLPLKTSNSAEKVQYESTLLGKVTCSKTGKQLYFANIALYQNEKLINGGQTDLEGNYEVNHLPKGTYDVEVSYLGFETKRIEGVEIQGKMELDILLEPAAVELEECVIVAFAVPIISQEICCGGTFCFSRCGGDKIRTKIRINEEGVEASSILNFEVFPNPSIDRINLRFQSENQRIIRLIDQSGKMLFQQKIGGSLHQLSLSDFSAGSYYLQVEERNQVKTEKVVLVKR